MRNNAFLMRAATRRAHTVRTRSAPVLIGVTGVIGNKSAVQAIATVLRAGGKTVHTHTRQHDDAHAVLDGLLDLHACGGSFSHWLRAVRLSLRRLHSYPDVIVVEYAGDGKGEIERALAVAVPDIVVFTSHGAVNLAAHASPEAAFAERSMLVKALKKIGVAILYHDDKQIRALAEKIKARVLTYGTSEDATVRGRDIAVTQGMDGAQVRLSGTNMKLAYDGSTVPTQLQGVVGGPHVFAALAAAAVGVALELNLVTVAEALKQYVPLPGRMRVIAGIKSVTLIDDTYTATGASMIAGLETLAGIEGVAGAERFALLGSVLHSGAATDDEYVMVGRAVAQHGIGYLMTVGAEAHLIGDAAREAGMDEARVYHFAKTEDAGNFFEQRLEKGDIAYLAGTAREQMEVIVRDVMADPLRAEQLIVRR